MHARDEAALRAHLEAFQREPVVSLASVRRLHAALGALTSIRPDRRLLATIQAAIAESQASTAAWLFDRVERVLEQSGPAPVAELARLVARDDIFVRISRFIRRSRAQFGALTANGDVLPHVDVGPHLRQGRPVRGYSRYVGYEHLRGLPGLATRPAVVQRVVRCLVDGEHRRRA